VRWIEGYERIAEMAARHGVKPREVDAPDGVKPIEWRLLRLVGVKLLWI